MPTVWFCIVAVMIAAYVVLDGFDLGAGIIYLGVGKTDDRLIGRPKDLDGLRPISRARLLRLRSRREVQLVQHRLGIERAAHGDHMGLHVHRRHLRLFPEI